MVTGPWLAGVTGVVAALSERLPKQKFVESTDLRITFVKVVNDSRCPAEIIGPRSVSSSSGGPTFSSSVRLAMAATKSSYAERSTKIRLLAQQS